MPSFLLSTAVLCCLMLVCGPGKAASFEWTGNGDGSSWQDADNWDSERYPGDGSANDDRATIDRPNGVASVSLGENITLAGLVLGRGVRLRGGQITITEDGHWSDGELNTTLVVSPNAHMVIDGAAEKRLDGSDGRGRINNAGELVISGSSRLHLLFDPQIRNFGRLILRGPVLIQGSRCCIPPVQGISNAGEIFVEASPFSLPVSTATLANMALQTNGPINIAANATLTLEGGVHEFSDGVRVQGGPLGPSIERGVLRLLFAEASLGRLYVATGNALEVTDRSRLRGRAVLTGPGTYRWLGGTLYGTLRVASDSTLELSGSTEKLLDASQGGGRLTNEGNIRWMDSGQIGLLGPAAIENIGSFGMVSGARILGYSCCTTPATFQNSGRLEKGRSSETTEFAGLFLDNAGTFDVAGGVTFNGGAEFHQLAGDTVLRDATLVSGRPIDISGGTLQGNGTIEGTLVNARAQVSPGLGQAAGRLAIAGDFRQGREGTLRLELGGTETGVASDLLEVAGTATLDGERLVAVLGSYRPALGESIEVIRYGQRRGTFARVSGLDLNNVFLHAAYTDGAPPPSQPGTLQLVAVSGPLRSECRAPPQPLEWDQINGTIAQIIGQSDTATNVWQSIQGRFRVLSSEAPPESKELGVVGRLVGEENNRDLTVARFAWSRLNNAFQAASIFTHEMGHGQQVLRRRFTSTEAAPFLNSSQYVILRWWDEYEAFRLQATALDEVTDSNPDFERCRANFLKADPRVERLTAGLEREARREITLDYDRQGLEVQWQNNSAISNEERERLRDVEMAVQRLLGSPEWQRQVSIWTDFIPVQ